LKLLLVRNAETLWNKEKRLHGYQDSPMTETGQQQMKTLASILENESIDVVYSSDLGRAIDTAKQIVSHHQELEIQKRRELRERSHGIAEGKTQHDVFEEYPKLQQERLKNKYTYKNPKGESYIDAEQRLRPFIEELKQKHFSHTVLLVSHAGINRIIIGVLSGLTPDETMAIDQPHDVVYVIDNADTAPEISRMNQTGIEKGILRREHLKKPSFEEEESENVELEDDWV